MSENYVTFINADLVLYSNEDIGDFVGKLRKRGFSVLHDSAIDTDGGYQSVLELDQESFEGNFLPVIDGIFAIIEELPVELRLDWDQLAAREIDLGFEISGPDSRGHWTMPPDLVRRAAELGLTLSVTVYSFSLDP